MVRQALRSNDIRESNEKLVLSLIFQAGRASQSEIVQSTGLKAPTVFRIFTKLEEEGFIRLCGEEDAGDTDGRKSREKKGRRPSFYCVRPEACYAVGVDFSSLAASVIVVNFGNEVIDHESIDLAQGLDRDSVLDRIAALIHAALNRRGLTAERVIGLGVAAPGVVDTVEGRVVQYGRIEGLSDYSIKDRYEAEFGVPVYVHNNASVIAASVYHYGHYGPERSAESLLAILVRSGVGGALVENGKIFLNGTRTALEIGSLSAGTRTAPDPADAGRDTDAVEAIVAEGPMLARLWNAFGVTSWEEVEVKLSVDEVRPHLEQARRSLGLVARDLYHVFRPELILLIVRFSVLADILGEALREAVPEARVSSIVYDPVQACFGATDLVFRAFFARDAAVV